MIKRIKLSSKHIEELRRIAEKALPYESCALLIGSVDGSVAVVDYIIELENITNSSIIFMMNNEELYNIYMMIRREGKEIVSIFHSHPSKAEPSNMDLMYMSINQIPWIIMSNIDYRFDIYAYYDKLVGVEYTILDA